MGSYVATLYDESMNIQWSTTYCDGSDCALRMQPNCSLELAGTAAFGNGYIQPGDFITFWSSYTVDLDNGGCQLVLNGTSLVI